MTIKHINYVCKFVGRLMAVMEGLSPLDGLDSVPFYYHFNDISFVYQYLTLSHWNIIYDDMIHHFRFSIEFEHCAL